MTTTELGRLFDGSEVVLPPPAGCPGNWSGASSVVLADGVFWLAYRVRRPLTAGRGVATVVASSDNGRDFTTVAELPREKFGAESFERPALVAKPDGAWRIFLSCATPNTKHWWIEAVDAPTPADLPTGA